MTTMPRLDEDALTSFGYWLINGNYWDKLLHTYGEALDKAATMIDCTDCVNCAWCTNCIDCVGCTNCHMCISSTLCNACTGINNRNTKVDKLINEQHNYPVIYSDPWDKVYYHGRLCFIINKQIRSLNE